MTPTTNQERDEAMRGEWRQNLSEWRETLEAVQMFGLPKVLYWRFVYRHHMLFIHKRGRHQLKHIGPLYPDGGEFDKCEWCGRMENVHMPLRFSANQEHGEG